MKASARRVITRSPENSETPIDALRSWITPNEKFYVRNHFDDPIVDPSSWTLSVTGCVEREHQFSWPKFVEFGAEEAFFGRNW